MIGGFELLAIIIVLALTFAFVAAAVVVGLMIFKAFNKKKN
jgi:hypothetical protein